jgi:hypothetical protein
MKRLTLIFITILSVPVQAMEEQQFSEEEKIIEIKKGLLDKGLSIIEKAKNHEQELDVLALELKALTLKLQDQSLSAEDKKTFEDQIEQRMVQKKIEFEIKSSTEDLFSQGDELKRQVNELGTYGLPSNAFRKK